MISSKNRPKRCFNFRHITHQMIEWDHTEMWHEAIGICTWYQIHSWILFTFKLSLDSTDLMNLAFSKRMLILPCNSYLCMRKLLTQTLDLTRKRHRFFNLYDFTTMPFNWSGQLSIIFLRLFCLDVWKTFTSQSIDLFSSVH